MAQSIRTRVDVFVDKKDVDRLLETVDRSLRFESLEKFLHERATPWFQQRAEKRFDGEGDAASGAWAPLRYPTHLIRALQGYDPEHPINVRDGDLRAFVTYAGGTTGAAAGLGAGAELTWPGPATGETAQKFKVAQTGSKPGENPIFPNGSTVPRPVVRADVTDMAGILGLLASHLVDELSGGGFGVLFS